MAQLKSTVVQGNLTASGNVNATKIIKHGGASTEILMADGSVEKINELDYIPLSGTSGVTGDITSSAKITATEFVGPATQLKTGRTLKVNLGSTSASTAFNGTANITDIGVSGTLPVANGGTGQTTGTNAANYFLNALSTGESVPGDNDYYISQYVNGGTTHTTFHRRPVKHLYSYIKDKTDDLYVKLLGSSDITGDLKTTGNIEGAIITAKTKFVGNLEGTADKAKQDASGNTITSTYVKKAGDTMTGTLGFKSNYLIKPVADYRTTNGKHEGMITVTLPASIGHTMVSMWIDVYNYVAHTSFSVHVGGYTYNNTTWEHNPFAMVYGANHKVRLGHDGTSFVIYIGEQTSVWQYPQITVRDVMIGYSPSYANWFKDWSIGFTTTAPLNVTKTITDYVWTTKNLTPSNYIPLTGSTSITGDLKTSGKVEATNGFVGNLTGNVTGDVSGNAGTATKLQTTRTINGTNFDGSANITTTNWGTARNITIGNETKSVNGSTAYNWTLAQIGAVKVAGDTMTGDLKMGGNAIHSKYYKITDGTNVKATYQYSTADDCVELIFA